MRKIQARKGPMRIESHTTSLYQTILHRHPRIPAATLELTPRRCRSACKFLTRPFRKLQQAVRINPESLKLNAGQEIFAKHSQVAVGGVDFVPRHRAPGTPSKTGGQNSLARSRPTVDNVRVVRSEIIFQQLQQARSLDVTRLSRNCDLFVDEMTFVFFYEHCDGDDSSESFQGFLLPDVLHLGTLQIVP